MVTVLCRAWGQCRAHGPPEEAPLRDPIPEAEMMSAGGGTHVRSKLLCAAWEGQARARGGPGMASQGAGPLDLGGVPSPAPVSGVEVSSSF